VACDAATLEALQVLTNKQGGLSERDTLICLASVLGASAGYSSAQVAVSAAASDKLAGVSDRDLLAITLSLLC